MNDTIKVGPYDIVQGFFDGIKKPNKDLTRYIFKRGYANILFSSDSLIECKTYLELIGFKLLQK